MKNTQDFDTLTAHTVRNQVSHLGDHELPSPGHSARPSQSRALREQLDRMNNFCDDMLRRLGIVLGDIGGLFVEIAQRLAQPDDYQGCYAALRHFPRTFFTSDGLAKSPASASCKAA